VHVWKSTCRQLYADGRTSNRVQVNCKL